MYKSSRNRFDPSHSGVYIGGENYWPVKIKHQSTGRIMWVNLQEDEPTVRALGLLKKLWLSKDDENNDKQGKRAI